MLPTEFDQKIKNYFFLNRELHLPGLGVFTQYHIDQYLSPSDTIIHPPFQKIRFSRSFAGDNKNQKFKKYYINKKFYKHLEVRFQDVLNDVLNFGLGSIEGLGIIKQNEKGELRFISDTLIVDENRYLPIIDTLSFNEGDRMDEKTNVFSSLSKTPSPKAYNHEKPLPFVETSHEKKAIISDKISKTSQSHKVLSSKNIWAIIGTAAVLLIAIFMIKRCDFTLKNSKIPIVESSMSIGALMIENDPLAISQDVIVKDVIIVGSFTKRTNALHMASEIDHIYNAEIYVQNNLYRVGILVDKMDYSSVLEIRTSIASDAWWMSSDKND
ncbi:MAG: hypothetical protein V3V00_00940 [Saprospiraceae bacterium]